MSPAHSIQLNATTHNWRRKGYPASSGSRGFTTTSLVATLSWLPITKPCWAFSKKTGAKEDRATPSQASSRIKRYYEYTLVFRNTTVRANADALSRLPLPEEPATTFKEPELVLLAEHLADSPVTASDIHGWKRCDKKLSRVLQYVQQGWPSEGDVDLEPYSTRRLELSTFEGCILWGSRVVISVPGREAVLRELHEGHPGMTQMKALARMYMWWPGINSEIEKSVRLCQEVQATPPVAPLNPWKYRLVHGRDFI